MLDSKGNELFKDVEPEIIQINEDEEDKKSEIILMKIKLNTCNVWVVELEKVVYLKIFRRFTKSSIYIKINHFNNLINILKNKKFI